MEYVNLGKSDLKVSRICMGCMGFGNAATGQHSWTVDEEISKSIIKRGLELGTIFMIQQLHIRPVQARNILERQSENMQKGMK